jgi:HD-like signal output (HDOD) protein
MRVTSIQSLLQEADLPALPEVYARLTTATAQADSSATAISGIIKDDSELAEHLLKLANSALFNFPHRVKTIAEAVQRIGAPHIDDLALGVIVVGMLGKVNSDLVSIQSFWRHNIACAIAARVIAVQRQEQSIERFFVAGLLHDIGSLMLYPHLNEGALMALLRDRDKHVPLYRLERDVLGFNHADLGAAILRQWAVPDALQTAVAFHHAPSHAPHDALLAATVHVADIIANAMELGSRGQRRVPPLAPDAWQRIGLPVATLPTIMAQVETQLESVVAALIP